MILDDNAAAYGLFQLVFASLVQQFAVAVWRLQQMNDPQLKFDKVFARNFDRLRRELMEETKQFDGRRHGEELADIRRACAQAKRVASWRNPRIHARVRLDNNGITIHDQATGKPLTIIRDECTAKIEESIGIVTRLDFAVARLMKAVQSQREGARRIREALRVVEQKTS